MMIKKHSNDAMMLWQIFNQTFMPWTKSGFSISGRLTGYKTAL